MVLPSGERRCRACANASAHGRPMTTAMLNRLKKEMTDGASLNQILNGKPVGGGPIDRSLVITTPAKFNHQRKIDPEFANFVAKHIEPAISVAQAVRYA